MKQVASRGRPGLAGIGASPFNRRFDQRIGVGSEEGTVLQRIERRLKSFSNRLDSLEKVVNRIDTSGDGEFVVAVEMLQGETEMLRTEIREFQPSSRYEATEMAEYATETWDQLTEALEELESKLGGVLQEDDEYDFDSSYDGPDEEDDDEDDWSEDDDEDDDDDWTDEDDDWDS